MPSHNNQSYNTQNPQTPKLQKGGVPLKTPQIRTLENPYLKTQNLGMDFVPQSERSQVWILFASDQTGFKGENALRYGFYVFPPHVLGLGMDL